MIHHRAASRSFRTSHVTAAIVTPEVASAACAIRVRPAGAAAAHEARLPVRLTSLSAASTARSSRKSIFSRSSAAAVCRAPISGIDAGARSQSASVSSPASVLAVFKSSKTRAAAEEVEISRVWMVIEEPRPVPALPHPGPPEPIEPADIPAFGAVRSLASFENPRVDDHQREKDGRDAEDPHR